MVRLKVSKILPHVELRGASVPKRSVVLALAVPATSSSARAHRLTRFAKRRMCGLYHARNRAAGWQQRAVSPQRGGPVVAPPISRTCAKTLSENPGTAVAIAPYQR